MVNEVLDASPEGAKAQPSGEEDSAETDAGEESGTPAPDAPITPDFFTASPKRSRFRR
jgi:hypothetical protein